MSKHYLVYLGLLSGLLLIGTTTAQSTENGTTFKIAIYKNSKCKGKREDALPMDTAKSCNAYSYTDSKGVLTSGSHNNFRCYKDKVVFDKYPFSANCSAKDSVYQGKEVVEKDHTLIADKCQEAPSHEGPVYEKLIDYKYPGNENCTEKK